MDSPFTDKLGTNYAPSDSEIAQIRKAIALQTAMIADLDHQIDALRQRRDTIQASVDAQKALISLPRRLPRDLLEEIFYACLPKDTNAAMVVTEAPLLLTRIYSVWRDIALTTPRLWASLHIPLSFFAGTVDKTPALAEWFRRSGSCPLSLSIVGERRYSQPEWGTDWGANSGPVNPLTDTFVEPIERLLLANTHRLCHLQLNTYTVLTMTHFLQQPLPMLYSLEVAEPHDWTITRTLRILPMVSINRSTLRKLSIPYFQLRDGIRDSPDGRLFWELLEHGSWSHITHLTLGLQVDQATQFGNTLGRILFSEAIGILRCCTQLEDFRFAPRQPRLEGYDSDWDIQATTGSHSQTRPSWPDKWEHTPPLRVLIVFGAKDPSYSFTLFTDFWNTLPPILHLVQLAIDVPDIVAPTELDGLLEKIPALASLTLALQPLGPASEYWQYPRTYGFGTIDGLDAALNQLHNGQGDYLPWLPTVASFLRLLTPSCGRALCPDLRQLIVANCLQLPFRTEILDMFLTNHVAQSTHFRHLQMHFVGRTQAVAISPECFTHCSAAGLNIEITGCNNANQHEVIMPWQAQVPVPKALRLATTGRMNMAFN